MPFEIPYKNLMLDALPSNVLLALFNGNPSTSGVEVVGSGYVRKAATLAAASAGVRQLAADVNFGFSTGAAWTQATYVAVYNSAGTVRIGYSILSAPFTTDATNALLLVANTDDLALEIVE